MNQEKKLSKRKIQEMQEIVLTWYYANAKEYPWRVENPNPYVVLVSETMLQQTQSSRVAVRLPQFLEEYPTIAHLAKATNATILRSWQGMGYNSRALRLRDTAKEIVQKYNGKLPQSYTELRALPGVGDYTARAILSFAFSHDIHIIDVNIRRVYSRIVYKQPTNLHTATEAQVKSIADSIFPTGKSSVWHQAVMDIGNQFCSAQNPVCSKCPLTHVCASASSMIMQKPQPKQEPSFQGIPNRLWRGRIIKHLSHLAPKEVATIKQLLQHLEISSNKPNEEWLKSILLKLEVEKLIEQRKSGFALSSKSA